MESPNAVQNVVGSGGADETYGIAKVFVDADFFLAEIGYPEVDNDAREAYDAEFQEFQYEELVNYHLLV